MYVLGAEPNSAAPSMTVMAVGLVALAYFLLKSTPKGRRFADTPKGRAARAYYETHRE